MNLAAAQRAPLFPALASIGRVPLIVLCLAGACLFGYLDYHSAPSRLATELGDSDDAMRLVQVRELMAGASWFDTTLPRVGGAEPLVSHWSRLIDLPLAILLTVFGAVMKPETAEIWVRALWPLSLFTLTLWFLTDEAERQGGRKAAVWAIFFTLASLAGRIQFLPGRIDHHNAMILSAVGGLILLARSFTVARTGWAAGALLGLGAAIGYEALPLTISCLAATALLACWWNRGLDGVTNAATSFAATLALALVVTVPPSRLFEVHCDALSINLLALAASAAVGLWISKCQAARLGFSGRVGVLAAAGLSGLALYGLAEPQCFKGPFGQVDPAIVPIWLSTVKEAQSIVPLIHEMPLLAIYLVGSILAALAAGLANLRRSWNDAATVSLVILVIAIALGLWQQKLQPYVSLLAVPMLAVAMARVGSNEKAAVPRNFSATARRSMSAAAVLAAATLTVLVARTDGVDELLAEIETGTECVTKANISALDSLPKALAVADVNMGPFLVAWTKLDALSAPYHRLGRGIASGHAIMNSRPLEAERRMRTEGARYVIVCPHLNGTHYAGQKPDNALMTLLLKDEVPAFLTPVPLDRRTTLKVFQLAN